MKSIFTTLLLFLLGIGLQAQTFCLQLSEVSNDGTTLVVKIEMSGSTAFELGSSNLQWSYNTALLSNPTLQSSNLPGPPFYSVGVSTPNPGEASLNIELSFPDIGTTIGDSWTEVAQVSYTMLNPASIGEMLWLYNGGTTQTVAFLDNEATQIFATDPACLIGLLNPAPVELVSFTAKKGGDKVYLDWLTAAEENSEGFEIQKSRDGIRWEEISWVNAQGLSHTNTKYNFIDAQPFAGDNYYRLKVFDWDQSFEYTNIETVNFSQRLEATLFPNPARDQVGFSYSENSVLERILIYDQVGKLQMNVTPDQHQVLDLANLNGGVYFVEMHFEEGLVHKKLLINK